MALSLVPRLRLVRNSAAVSSLLFLRAGGLTSSPEDTFSYVEFPWSFRGVTVTFYSLGGEGSVQRGPATWRRGLGCFLDNSTRNLTVSRPGVQ